MSEEDSPQYERPMRGKVPAIAESALMDRPISRQVKELQDLPTERRVALAKAKMEQVLNHFLYLLELHANNSFVIYSPILAKQIPTSFAANAFNVFQRGMHQIEIVRLCALWDSADLQKENIPTVIELIDDAPIIQILADETRSHWANQPVGHFPTEPNDPELCEVAAEVMKASNIHFGDQQAALAVSELSQAINCARDILSSDTLNKVMNLRDRHLAHSLEKTYREKHGPIEPMQYGDETNLLNSSVPIIEKLLNWVNGKSFSIANSQKIDHENAQALWAGCTFKVLR
jgi:AbiU2